MNFGAEIIPIPSNTGRKVEKFIDLLTCLQFSPCDNLFDSNMQNKIGRVLSIDFKVGYMFTCACSIYIFVRAVLMSMGFIAVQSE